MNTKYICRNPKHYQLTEGNVYELLLEDDSRICIKNDNNKIAFYASNLFELVEEETSENEVPTPLEPLTEEEIIQTIIRRGLNIEVFNSSRITLLFGDFRETLSADRMDASCGIGDVVGINALSNRIEEFVDNNYEGEDYDSLRKELFKKALFLELNRLNSNSNKALFLISTAMTSETLAHPLYYDVLNEEATFSSNEIRNPNSGNDIKLWGFETTGPQF
jgi:hypothetical protein